MNQHRKSTRISEQEATIERLRQGFAAVAREAANGQAEGVGKRAIAWKERLDRILTIARQALQESKS